MTSVGDLSVNSRSNRMLNRIYHKLQAENINASNECPSKKSGEVDKNETCAILRASKLTGLSKRSLFKVDLIKYNLVSQENNMDHRLNRYFIQAALTKFILQKLTLPTTRELFDEIINSLPFHIEDSYLFMDIYSFKKMLVQYDFVWKYIPGYNTFVVMERPCVTYERYSFLKRFIECVDGGMTTYFIDEFVIGPEKLYNLQDSLNMPEDMWRKRVIYAASENEVLKKSVDAFNELEFKLFVVEILLPALRKPSVVVMDNAEHHCEKFVSSKPSISSLKDDLKTWLDKHNVPYDNNMSRAELFLLTERCTNKECSIYVIDNVLRAHGHLPLRLPHHINYPTPSAYLFSTLETEFSTTGNELKFAQEQLIDHLGRFSYSELTIPFQRTMYAYRKMLKDDKEVDDLLDDVVVANLTQKPSGGDVDSDIPDLSDSE